MKKLIITTLVIGAILTSCSNNGKKAETKDAEKVETIKKETTITFKTVKDGSHVDWRATHLGGLKPRYGKVLIKKAKFLVNDNKLANAKVEMDMVSFTVESFPEGDEQIEQLTGHLKSADFFDVGKYPVSTFELTKTMDASGVYNSTITGNLTIMDVTKSITFDANIIVSDNEVSIKSEDFSVNRTDWGLIYNVEGTAGVSTDYLISNDIGFTIDVTLGR
ncbi:MAG: hypothetical protein DRJ05_08650 [Bacteroidetes bacterium]|nr:MAG: hypothetical protein DRJ05_08650 [Bacteroidota bacterium]